MLIISWLSICLGSIVSLIAAIGVYRLPIIFSKMHAATKSATLGTGLVLLGVGLQLDGGKSLTEILLLIGFIMLTNPIAAHLIARTLPSSGKQCD